MVVVSCVRCLFTHRVGCSVQYVKDAHLAPSDLYVGLAAAGVMCWLSFPDWDGRAEEAV